jgi:ribosomal protein S18 acetylase RimI-like enzyme
LKRLCTLPTRDVYLLARWGARVIGYGLLRGWDEGYEIPSLGIAVHPRFRGQRVGLALMHVLHAVARLRGASRIRLKVYPDNRRALSLYRRLGYRFRGVEKGQRVGYLDL